MNAEYFFLNHQLLFMFFYFLLTKITLMTSILLCPIMSPRGGRWCRAAAKRASTTTAAILWSSLSTGCLQMFMVGVEISVSTIQSGNFIKVRVCLKQTSSHVWRHPGWKACHHREGRDRLIAQMGKTSHTFWQSLLKGTHGVVALVCNVKVTAAVVWRMKKNHVYFTLPIVSR